MSVNAVLRGVTYAFVLLLGVVLAIWGAFFVPLRVGAIPLPLGLVLALAVVPLCRAGGRLLDSRAGAAGPWVLWCATALLLSSQRSEGDLIVTNSLRGVGFLAIGFFGGAVAVGQFKASGPRPTRRSTEQQP